MIPLASTFKTISREDNRAVFEIGGFYPGYGLTVANALRRVLLSSLSGTAVTRVKIEGAPHEFSTLPHVKEDVIQILFNLKKLKFVLPDDHPYQTSLEVKGERKVAGRDFNLSPQVKLTNPGEHIATLTNAKARLVVTITIESGVGYQPAEVRQAGKSVIGDILLDAAFSPVERVAYRVENMRVGNRTDFNKIILTVETNGAVAPEDALTRSASLLSDHFKIIADSFKTEKPKKAEIVKKKNLKNDVEVKKIKIEEISISARTAGVLQQGGIKTVSGLISKTPEKVLAIEGMGEKGLNEVKKALKKLGLNLKE